MGCGIPISIESLCMGRFRLFTLIFQIITELSSSTKQRLLMGKRRRKQGFALPSDLVQEILSRLSLKSLSRFRFVCKSWLHMISYSSSFAKMIQTHKKPRCLLFCHGISKATDGHTIQPLRVKTSSSRSEISSVFDVYESDSVCLEDKKFVGSANGLLCFSSRSPTFDGYYICNPITQEGMQTLEIITDGDEYVQETIAGFGFDCISNSFKIVQIVSYPLSKSVEADLYDQGSNTWKKVKNVPNIVCHAVRSGGNGVFVNGSLHWFAAAGLESVLISFELTCEKFRTIQLPDLININYPNNVIGVLDDSLCICDNFREARIWVSKNQNYEELECWTEKYVFSKKILRTELSSPYLDGNRFVESKNDEVMTWSNTGTLGFYDPKLVKFKPIKVKNYYSNAIVFHGTVSSPTKPMKNICIKEDEI